MGDSSVPKKPAKPGFLLRSHKDESGFKVITPRSSAIGECLCITHARQIDKDFFVFYISLTLATGRVVQCAHRYSDFAKFHAEWKQEYASVDKTLPPKLMKLSDEVRMTVTYAQKKKRKKKDARD